MAGGHDRGGAEMTLPIKSAGPNPVLKAVLTVAPLAMLTGFSGVYFIIVRKNFPAGAALILGATVLECLYLVWKIFRFRCPGCGGSLPRNQEKQSFDCVACHTSWVFDPPEA